MRADRLLSLLMLLQARGRMTASQLAMELEVSTRTIYRDVDALCSAGVPVYVLRGPGGGIDLLEAYRTNLTGLSDAEVQALFMISIPAALVELGVGGDLRAALRKLTASLSSHRRLEARRVQERFHLDNTAWGGNTGEISPTLGNMQRALMEDRVLRLRVRLPFEAKVDQDLAPFGLVAKEGSWYLVGEREGRVRVLQVSRVIEAKILNEVFIRPASFDLEGYWGTWCEDRQRTRSIFTARLRISPRLLYHLERSGEIHELAPADEEREGSSQNWQVLNMEFESFYDARSRILGFGGACEVLEPESLRLSVADFAVQTSQLYQSVSDS